MESSAEEYSYLHADTSEVIDELELYDPKVVRKGNWTQNNKSFPFFSCFWKLGSRDNNKNIYNLKTLLHMVISFEPLTKKTRYIAFAWCQAFDVLKGTVRNISMRQACFTTPDCPGKRGWNAATAKVPTRRTVHNA